MNQQPNQYVEVLENWIPGIGECTELHDCLHDHFGLDFSVNSEARLLGFQCGHHPASSILHVLIFCLISSTIYPADYRNRPSDLLDFYRSFLVGKEWQMVSYWFCPRDLLHLDRTREQRPLSVRTSAPLELGVVKTHS